MIKGGIKYIETPIGKLQIKATEKGVSECVFIEDGDVDSGEVSEIDARVDEILKEAETQLKQYFAGERRDFELLIDEQGTDCQRGTWAVFKRRLYC